MTDFIREVDEEVRQDRMRTLARRYWIVGVALAVLVLAGVGAWQIYTGLRTSRAEAAGGRYLGALDLARDGKVDEATAALKAVADGDAPGYRLLARARLAAETGLKDSAAGARLFDALADDGTVDPAIRNVMRLRAAMLLMDTASYADLKARLDPLADANSPVRNIARELLALAALKAGAEEEAGRTLEALAADPTATGQQRQRVDALRGLVRGAAKQPAGAAPAAVPAAPSPPAAAPAPAPAP